MPNFKPNRQQEDVKRVLPEIFRAVKDPRVGGLLSVVRVELAGDYSHCKIYVSSLGGIGAARESVTGLRSAAGFIRSELCRRVKMRRSPELQFIADDSIEHSAHIAKLLEEMRDE